jgi:hypothetical protein
MLGRALLRRALLRGLAFSANFLICFTPFTLWAFNVPKYGIFELTLTSAENYPNPYLKMPGDDTSPGFVEGRFTGPNDETITIDGFWDGGDTWKIRMAPTAIGTWTYTTSSPDSGIDGESGSFECIPSSSHGFVRIHPDNPFAFAYDDGTPFFWLGDSIPIFYIVANLRFDDGSFQRYVDNRAVIGVNNSYFGSWIFKKTGNFAQNEGGYNFNNNDPDQLNPAFWQWADKRLEYTVSKGIVPGLGIGWPDQRVQNFGDNRLMRAWRFMIARYAAYNVMWDVIPEPEDYLSGWERWLRKFGKAVEKFDPYAHLTSYHPGGNPGTSDGRTATPHGNDAWLDFNTQQLCSNLASIISQDRQYGKPVENHEFCFESSDIIRRKKAWEIVTNGGYIGWYDHEDSSVPVAGLMYMSYIGNFFRQKTKFWLLQPHNEYIIRGTGYCTAITGEEYVVYLPSGGSVTVDLSIAYGTLPVEWYNPATGETTAAESRQGGTSRSFTAPDVNDWVLHIGGGVIDGGVIDGGVIDTIPPAPPTGFDIIGSCVDELQGVNASGHFSDPISINHYTIPSPLSEG